MYSYEREAHSWINTPKAPVVINQVPAPATSLIPEARGTRGFAHTSKISPLNTSLAQPLGTNLQHDEAEERLLKLMMKISLPHIRKYP